MIYVSAIVLAAGKSKRFGSNIHKPLAKIDAYPVIFYSLDTLSRHPLIKDIVLVVNAQIKSGIERAAKEYRTKKIYRVVIGGMHRQDSVYEGLKAVNKRTELVLIHDGARPFVDKDSITRTIKEAARSGAAIAGVPVKATIKEVKSLKLKVQSRLIVKKTLNRDKLQEIQTPQVFRRDLILRAYNKFADKLVTDDAAIVEKLGVKVRVVKGSYLNIKITTPEDLALAKAIHYLMTSGKIQNSK